MKITKRQLRRVIREAILEEMAPVKTAKDRDGIEYPTSYEGFNIQQSPDGTWLGWRYDYGRPYRYPNHPTKESLFKIIDRHQKRYSGTGFKGDDAKGSQQTRSFFTSNSRDQDLSKMS